MPVEKKPDTSNASSEPVAPVKKDQSEPGNGGSAGVDQRIVFGPIIVT
jgi:hypothetical protein